MDSESLLEEKRGGNLDSVYKYRNSLRVLNLNMAFRGEAYGVQAFSFFPLL